MGNLDRDYLWLHEQSQRGSGLRRLAVVLVVCLMAGTAWLLTSAKWRDDIPTSMPRHAHRAAPEAGHGHAQTATVADLPLERSSTLRALNIIPDAHRSAAAPTSALDLAKERGLDTPENRVAPAPVAADNNTGAHNPSRPTAKAPQATDNSTSAKRSPHWRTITIASGDTLSIAFNRHGLSYVDSLHIAHLPKYGSRFTDRLQAGDSMRVRADDDGHVLALDYPLDNLHKLDVRRNASGYAGHIVLDEDIEHRRAYVTGVIDTSFYLDALESGLTDGQIMKLVRIFGWDIDFALDIRRGDRFVVVFDELYRHGDKIGNGHILAASFINRGHDVRAVRYTSANDKSAFYSPSGRPMRKAFIRTPVDYTRVSSPFSLARRHPILNRIRKHEGTDYAAPKGTPIKAAGAGRIVFRGRRGGYGNMIIIRHNKHVTTRYGHMNRFAKQFGLGSKVRQGDVIGYVGMTGLATGPHLHYEFRVDGKPKDPQTVKLPRTTEPIPHRYMADFKRRAKPLLAQLDTLTHTYRTRVAINNPDHTEL